MDTELIFVAEEDIDGGYTARALGYSIFTQGDTTEELHRNIREVVDLFFEGQDNKPSIVRVHYVKDVVFSI